MAENRRFLAYHHLSHFLVLGNICHATKELIIDTQKLRRLSNFLLFATALISINGCSGIKVEKTESRPVSRSSLAPKTVAVIIENQSQPPKREKRKARYLKALEDTSSALSVSLPKLLTARHLIIADRANSPDLVLRCQILEVKGGSKLLRIFVGYGAGRVLLHLKVTLQDSSSMDAAPLLSFETNASSGYEPGGGAGIGAVVGGVFKSLKNDDLAAEIALTMHSIDTELAKYFASNGWPYEASPLSQNENEKK